MLPTKDPPQNKRPTQTESEWQGKKYSKKKDRKKKPGQQYLYQSKEKNQNKGHKKIQRRTLNNTQGWNPSRRHKHCKHIGTQHRSTQIHKENLRGLKDIDSNMLIVRNFNTVLSTMDRFKTPLPKKRINKDIVALNDALYQIDLIDTYRNFQPKEAK